jgi:hypothetical protein
VSKFAFILFVLTLLFNCASAVANDAIVPGEIKFTTERERVNSTLNQSKHPANFVHAISIINCAFRLSDSKWSPGFIAGFADASFKNFFDFELNLNACSHHCISFIRFLLYPNHFFW